ncbi:sporulation protein YjcZ [Paenibacillus thiaminolyticus]|uniref:Sporulation protein YjcZ n=1 Tax=Paenibacillus thiaminolyticus TaxID=49283 RepID=A0AAJ1G8W2_PANTH|nr:sporulation protein YjcZ [Paenibacillus thiaminolyticus]MCY9538801.1 sporulation protein YjcZ [Paenibacillus thiaminolyticus]MCY9604552.1 sporulation protein YjcZ [Paenibacillus thiaminolyticus]MCY9610589.1 sporulation protein YjcZ [Paenibacillus thiaminolyticus]MCY9614009.1 sporulation protein YjcZ [Paenibacillus thiaminolyticus]MCY9618546.1 sporulation protein YjcZ [Paenibacillus thiaminolyticus]
MSDGVKERGYGMHGLWTSTGVILVLFILLVIVSRGMIW